MSKTAKELKKELFYKKENGVDALSEDTVKAADDFCEGYKKFLFNCKTEREVAEWAVKKAEAAGFKPFDPFGEPLKAGEKVYILNRNKSIILALRVKSLLMRAFAFPQHTLIPHE